MKNEDWTHRLHERLKDYEASPPDGLWDDIASRIASEQRPKVRIIPLVRWTSVAAAVTLLLVGGAYLKYGNNAMPGTGGKEIVANAGQVAQATHSEASKPEAVPDNDPRWFNASTQYSCSSQQENSSVCSDKQPLPADDFGSPKQEETIRTTDSKGDEGSNEGTKNITIPSRGREPGKTSLLASTESPDTDFGRANRSSRFSLALNASGGLSGNQTYSGSMVMSSGLLVSSTMQENAVEQEPLIASYTERKHHMRPFSLGLSVGYALTERFSLLTGVVFTEAVSDFSYTVDMKQSTDRQTLRYIGIPLTASYKLLNSNRFSIYAKAGGQIDFNVSATLDEGEQKVSIDHDKPQFSLDAALGAEYEVFPHIGVYAEPGVRYYFNNGSSVENYFKEHPTAFNVELGVRVKF